MELRRQLIQGSMWVFLDQFGIQIVSFIVNLILARLLMPSDFGTIALFNVVINISSVLINGGLSSSLIRTPTIDNRDLSTVFWFNIATTMVLYFAIYNIAPVIAGFYHLSVLTNVIRVYSIVLVIDSFVGVQTVLFEKNLDFKTAFKIRFPSIVIGGMFGVFLALTGLGLWSLVLSALLQNLLYTIQYWFYSDWRPTFEFDYNKFKYHFVFGSRLTLSALLNVVFNNIYTIVIGKRFSEITLGFYNRAESLKNLPINNISIALNKVTYPLFVKFNDDDDKLRNAYRKVLKMVIFIIAPIICIMVIAAESVIGFLLGEKWLPLVPYFQIMAIGALFQPIHQYNLNVLHVKGRSDLYLWLEVIKKLLIVAIVLSSIGYGVLGLVWGQVVLSMISLFINTYYTGKFINYSMLQQLADLIPSILIACTIALMVWCIDYTLLGDFKDWSKGSIIIGSYLCIFVGVCQQMQLEEYISIKGLIVKMAADRSKINTEK